MPALSRKPLAALQQEEEKSLLVRELGLLDLAVVGVGGSLGSGVFSVVGSVAALDCGPGVIFAAAVGSFGCILTGYSYVKLSRAIPSTGGVYAYAYHALGEAFAVVAAACLTLDYAVSGSAVAASWGSKLSGALGVNFLDSLPLGPVSINIAALIVCAPIVAALLQGMDTSKQFTNALMILQLALVVFVIVSSLMLFKPSNLSPLVPLPVKVDGDTRYGADGLFTGTVNCFFAFVGFNEVCCLAGEAKDPKRDMPRAVIMSVSLLALFSILAGLGIVGMQHYTEIDPDDSFVVGLKAHNWQTSAWIVNVGELLTLPLVVFMSFLPQARLFYAMAMDGLMPSIFARVNSEGVLLQSNLIIGTLFTLLATVVDFGTFDELVSAGILLCFLVCNCSLIMLTLEVDERSHPWESSPSSEAQLEGTPAIEAQSLRSRAGMFLAVFCASSFVCMELVCSLMLPPTLFGWLSVEPARVQVLIIILACIFGLLALLSLAQLCGQRYDTQLGPVWLPAAAIIFNCLMLAALDHRGFLFCALYFAIVFLFYLGHGSREAASCHDEWMARSSLVSQQQCTTNGAALLTRNQGSPDA